MARHASDVRGDLDGWLLPGPDSLRILRACQALDQGGPTPELITAARARGDMEGNGVPDELDALAGQLTEHLAGLGSALIEIGRAHV